MSRRIRLVLLAIVLMGAASGVTACASPTDVAEDNGYGNNNNGYGNNNNGYGNNN